MKPWFSRALWLCLVCLLSVACRERRGTDQAPVPTFAEVLPLFEQACVSCHGEARAEAGYRMTSYQTVTGCVAGGELAVQPKSKDAPLIAVLSRPDHRGLLSESEEEYLLRWVEGGAPQSRSVMHPAGILDPRSEAWHGKLSASDAWAPLRDPESEILCGRCHEGAPLQPGAVTASVDSAPSCTSCHFEREGALACATCHGQGARAFPPRDQCLFVAEGRDAHAAHLTQTQFRSELLGCDTCHQVPESKQLFSGLHANGAVELRFDAELAGADAAYAAEELRCSVACHARGGEQAAPTWDSAQKLDCNACHLSPPKSHYPGACSTCHVEMGETPSSLTPGSLHINGKVDLGDGSGSCSACHGEGKDGWPTDQTHRAHRDTKLTLGVQCGECHVVPEELLASGHLNGEVDLRFAQRALRDELAPAFDRTTRGCSEVACHVTERGGGEVVTPRWGQVLPEPELCVSCHQTPPPPPHVQREGCGGGLCHGDEVAPSATGFAITEPGRSRHLDGMVKTGAGP